MYGKIASDLNHDNRLLHCLVDELLAQGLSAWVSYDRGHDRDEEGFGTLTTDREALLKALGECDEEHLFVGKDGQEIGYIFLVYGNSPGELISDYTTNLEKFMVKTNELADKQMQSA